MLPRAEFRVDDDFVVGTVPVDSVEESEVRKLALDRRRKSLKKGMSEERCRYEDYCFFIESD